MAKIIIHLETRDGISMVDPWHMIWDELLEEEEDGLDLDNPKDDIVPGAIIKLGYLGDDVAFKRALRQGTIHS